MECALYNWLYSLVVTVFMRKLVDEDKPLFMCLGWVKATGTKKFELRENETGVIEVRLYTPNGCTIVPHVYQIYQFVVLRGMQTQLILDDQVGLTLFLAYCRI